MLNPTWQFCLEAPPVLLSSLVGTPYVLRSSWTPVGARSPTKHFRACTTFLVVYSQGHFCTSGSADYPDYWTRLATTLFQHSASDEQLSIPIVSATRLSRGEEPVVLR
jgi:hypothetical protein